MKKVASWIAGIVAILTLAHEALDSFENTYARMNWVMLRIGFWDSLEGGEECLSGPDCDMGNCFAGPPGAAESYCVSGETDGLKNNCAFPRKSGVPAGRIERYAGKDYRCVQGTGAAGNATNRWVPVQ